MAKNSNRERPIQKLFCVSPEENQLIKKRMASTEIRTFQNYALKMCLHGQIFHVNMDDYREVVTTLSRTNGELNRIGNNINQIAKKLNTEDELSSKEFETLKLSLQQLTQSIISEIKSSLKELRDF